jgi:thiamine kinase-like enzyme
MVISIEDRISITDYVEVRPFPVGEAKNQLPDILRHLHSLSPFPKGINSLDTVDIVDIVDGFIQKFRDAKILPESITEEMFQLYAQVANVYPRHDKQNLVSCHNDLKPENILFESFH